MRFHDVFGQTATRKNLIAMWESGRMPHAMMLLGREGTGGLPMAVALAQFILCENKSPDDSCGECPNCQKVQRLEHADLHFSFPTISIKSGKANLSRNFIREFREFLRNTPYGNTFDWLQAINAENKQGNITADESREIINQLNLKSYEGGYKIQIIWRLEFLGKEGNILLKLIEEPPAETILIFVAENPEDIIATIRSRTQVVRLSPLTPAEISHALVEKGLAKSAKAEQIGQLADGSFTEALRLLEHIENDLLSEVRTLFNALFTNSGPGLVKFSESWAKEGREGIKNMLAYILNLLGGAVRATYVPETADHFAGNERDFILKLAARKLPVELYETLIADITDASYHIERNASSKSVLLSLCIKMHRNIRNSRSRQLS